MVAREKLCPGTVMRIVLRDDIEIGVGEEGITRRRDSNISVVVVFMASIPITGIRVVVLARIPIGVNTAISSPRAFINILTGDGIGTDVFPPTVVRLARRAVLRGAVRTLTTTL